MLAKCSKGKSPLALIVCLLLPLKASSLIWYSNVELIQTFNRIIEVHDTLHSMKEIMIIRILSCEIMLVFKLSLDIGSMRLDIVDLDN